MWPSWEVELAGRAQYLSMPLPHPSMLAYCHGSSASSPTSQQCTPQRDSQHTYQGYFQLSQEQDQTCTTCE